MNYDSAHKSKWAIAEVVFGLPFLASLAITLLAPIRLVSSNSYPALIFSGIIITGIGVYLVVLARREFRRYSQPTDPGFPTTRILHNGIFSLSRNPLYLGSVIVIAGISLLMNSLWALITLCLSIIISHPVLIFPEERYLTRRFGDEYREYAAQTRRWIGRRTRR